MADAKAEQILELDGQRYELVEFLRKDEESVPGNVMVTRTKEMGGTTDLRHAELLLARQNEIPEEWQAFCLVFPGTVRRDLDLDDALCVPYLHWYGGQWHLHWYLLECDGHPSDRVVRLCTPA